MSERNAEDFIELFLDTTGSEPRVVGRTRRSRGSRVLESEEALGAPGALSEEDVLAFLLRAVEGIRRALNARLKASRSMERDGFSRAFRRYASRSTDDVSMP
jgi:hypothetical protein